jgi:hypothetical protein
VIPPGQYRLGFKYRRDNRAQEPDSQIFRQAGSSDPEQVTIDIPSIATPVADAPAPLIGVPQLPDHLQERPEVLRLLENLSERPETATALVGSAGMGKTVLAAAYARAAETRSAFPDGVLWLNASDLGNLQQKLTTLLTTTSRIQRKRPTLEELLRTGRYLLIMDHVSSADQVSSVLRLTGPLCRVLFTTRKQRVAEQIGARIVAVGSSSEPMIQTQLSTYEETHLLTAN